MKNNLIKILFLLTLFFNLSLPVFSTELPENVVNFIKEKFPESGIRFDGLVELADGTSYLPVLPLVLNKTEDQLEITQTIPADQDFSQKPDMIIFNNNLALLKIIEKEGERPTLISSVEVPLKVKLGLLPQDLVVPEGLILPPELKVILGDLKIPLKPNLDKEGEIAFYGSTKIDEIPEQRVIGKTTNYVTNLPELEFLRGKNLYASNYRYKKINIINSQTGRIVQAIELPSMVFESELSSGGRYILSIAPILNKVFVVDTHNNKFVKDFEVGKLPCSVISPVGMKKAYVANSLSSSISEIDLTHMKVERELAVTGSPDNLYAMNDKNFLLYSDRRTGNIYQLNLGTGEVQNLLKVVNVSKMSQLGKYLFVLDRSKDILTIFDLEKHEVVKEIQTGKKPVDIKILPRMGRILVLCSESDELNLIDFEKFEVVKKIPLNSGGFPGKIELTSDTSRALITNYDTYEIIIYNVDAEKIQGSIPVSDITSRVIICDK